MTTVTVTNVERGDNSVTRIGPVSASAARPPAGWPVVIWSMLAVTAAAAIMWAAYSHWIRPASSRPGPATCPSRASSW